MLRRMATTGTFRTRYGRRRWGKAEELGRDPAAGAWVVTCEDHQALTHVDSKKAAARLSTAVFCDGCRGATSTVDLAELGRLTREYQEALRGFGEARARLHDALRQAAGVPMVRLTEATGLTRQMVHYIIATANDERAARPHREVKPSGSVRVG